MRPFRRVGLFVARIPWVRGALLETPPQQVPGSGKSLRLSVGMVLVVLSYVLGWPVVGLLGSLALTSNEPRLMVLAASAVYALSWVLLGIGVLVAGREVIPHFRRINRRCLRAAVNRMIGEPPMTSNQATTDTNVQRGSALL